MARENEKREKSRRLNDWERYCGRAVRRKGANGRLVSKGQASKGNFKIR